MRLPIPAIALLGSVAAVPRPEQRRADVHGAAAQMRDPLRTVGTVLARCIVWALIAIAVCACLMGLAALSTAGTGQSPPSHRGHATHGRAGTTHDPSSPPATAPTSQA